MYLITKSKDFFHAFIVELVPVIKSSNIVLLSRLTAGWSGSAREYLSSISVINDCRSRAYVYLDLLSWYASFLICHRFSARCIRRWHRLFAQVCAVLYAKGGWSLCAASCAIYWCCAYFHLLESRPRKRWFHPISHCSRKAEEIVSEIWSDVSQFSDGVPPDRYARIDRISIRCRSGCVPDLVSERSRECVPCLSLDLSVICIRMKPKSD